MALRGLQAFLRRHRRIALNTNLEWVAPNLEVADLAARIRGRHRPRTPDALQVATAVQLHATGLVTNDTIFKRVEAFETIVLDGLV